MSQETLAADVVDQAVAEGGAYEVIRKRLQEQRKQLAEKAKALNEARLAEFGDADMRLAGRFNVRTENNCVSRDIVQVGGLLLFGYNVFIGLKQETKVDDVFALFSLQESGDSYEMTPVKTEGTFLSDPGFTKDFAELYKYYKHTHLVQLTVRDGKLLAGFQVGERVEDIRVFRWSLSPDGAAVTYIDNRGERDIQLPPAYDFEWQMATRDNIIQGRHSHINILDKVFVDTLGGDLTIKVEDNTEDGLGIYREPVEDQTQALGDAEVYYASVNGLILLKILPYKETVWRYLVFNTLTQQVLRIDAIGESCVQLPEDHGIVFPGGYYLQTGTYKTFDEETQGLKFKRIRRSPNGEDVLYVFYRPDDGVVALLAYNLIEKELKNPMYGHGYALSEDGRLVIFTSEGQPTRVHPMQIWETPYVSDEYASKAPISDSFYGRIGNNDLVRGISDLYAIQRIIDSQTASVKLYESLSRSARKLFDAYYWIESEEAGGVGELVKAIAETSDLVIDEFVKVEAIRRESSKKMTEAEEAQEEILRELRAENWQVAEDYVEALKRVQRQRGHLATIKDYRYIDRERIAALDEELIEAREALGAKTIAFLSTDQALDPYNDKLDGLEHEIEKATKVADLDPLVDELESTGVGLDLLSELLTTLDVADATVRTQIVDSISQLYSRLNQTKASAKHKRKSMGSAEAKAQFAAQFKLFSQSIANALGLSTTPERSDEQMSRLLVQLEEMESQFSEHEEFLSDILGKREEIYESFEAHKQQLLDDRQRRAQAIGDAADRVLKSIERRSLKFTEAEDLNTYFASDALVLKAQELEAQLRELGSAVKADDVAARFKGVKDQAQRALRDKTEIFEDGGNVIKLGPRHRFSVNTQELDLTIIPRGDALFLHLTGTDYYDELTHPDLLALRDYWNLSLESESPDVYRSEFLAAQILSAAEEQREQLSMESLRAAALDDGAINTLVSKFAQPRYKEGYEKGVHDRDAALILQQLLPALESADLLRYDPMSRALAHLFWATLSDDENKEQVQHLTWQKRAQSAQQMRSALASEAAIRLLSDEIEAGIQAFLNEQPLEFDAMVVNAAARYLVVELSRERPEFIVSKYGRELVDELKRSLDDDTWRHYKDVMLALDGRIAERWNLSVAWLSALVDRKNLKGLERYVPEAAALLNIDGQLTHRSSEVDLEFTVNGLFGEHPRIADQTLQMACDTFLQRLEAHKAVTVPSFHRYQQTRQAILDEERRLLRPQEFKPRPLSSFVRNRLINDAYLPIIGDNLAKQMGTLGDNKRTDLMGLLMMISPPGYGKTTLMEYVANRLGLIFMKINCPSLGAEVVSLDPQQAPDVTAARELEKLNLGLEMGNNVMLYLDDIQHTNPEFLQKFISLTDATRRIEGVWKGQTKTYDMRGRKFCVVMAGNPYTESGEAFKVPDMLANRADVYNLGDILGGMEDQFALSYIENSLTSNPVLAPLATREMSDVYKLVDMAKGKQVATTDLSHEYSSAEVNEMTGVLKKLFVVQSIVLKINQQYIASAAQSDNNRTEPPFKLQGSYRNMNKMAEKISAVMNEDEMMQMIADHYVGEAQMLTSGAEENLLKLAELRGNMSPEQSKRWLEILESFRRNSAAGGDDPGTRIAGQLYDLNHQMQSAIGLFEERNRAEVEARNAPNFSDKVLEQVQELVKSLSNVQYYVEVVNEPVPGIDVLLKKMVDTLETSIYPLVHVMEGKLDIDLRTQENTAKIFSELKNLRALTTQKTTSSGRLKRKPAISRSGEENDAESN
ncbi:DNA repair ATPase [Thiosocius teredinicola]|uniref:DNA repair ATPase n=1 Tax=Thiosocius teredinicola TaxID=1973002 RepID=UPI000991436B